MYPYPLYIELQLKKIYGKLFKSKVWDYFVVYLQGVVIIYTYLSFIY